MRCQTCTRDAEWHFRRATGRGERRDVEHWAAIAGDDTIVTAVDAKAYEAQGVAPAGDERRVITDESGYQPSRHPIQSEPLGYLGTADNEGRTATVTRLLVATLALASVAANVAAAATVTGQLLHAVPPAMFVVCFETVIVTARRQALQRQGLWPAALPRVRPLAWILAPRATWTAWRGALLGSGSPVAVSLQPLVSVTGARPGHATRSRMAPATAGPRPGTRGIRHGDDRHAVAVRVVSLAPDNRRQRWPQS